MTSASVFSPLSFPEAVLIHAFSVAKSTSRDWWSDVLAVRSLETMLSRCEFRDLVNIVVSRGKIRWCAAYVESEQASLKTTKVTGQRVCLIWDVAYQRAMVQWQQGVDADWTLDVVGGGDAGPSSRVGATPLK